MLQDAANLQLTIDTTAAGTHTAAATARVGARGQAQAFCCRSNLRIPTRGALAHTEPRTPASQRLPVMSAADLARLGARLQALGVPARPTLQALLPSAERQDLLAFLLGR